ncbi:MAG TPA: Tim44-like domain-containing protein [Desulfobacterales bacterium]|nr:Tim44-like domain-containing protein [Desulfobacterales bacterium]
MTPKRSLAVLFVVFTLCFFYLFQEAAEAARMGGGKSFGSRPSYQQSARPPISSPTSPQSQPGLSQPNPMGGRWGGMLGGLVMGGLIGSLLFGGGHGFGGPGLMDILLLGGGLFLLMRYLRSRKTAAQSASSAGFTNPFHERSAQQGWGASGDTPDETAGLSAPATPPIPPGFDQGEFMKGAQTIYTRMQASWDKRDLEDIRKFTSPEVYAEIEKQAQEDPQPSRTEILLVNARLLEVRSVDNQEIASVHYDVMMREGAADKLAKQVREVWHFSRDEKAAASFWRLEGIQQVEG